MIASPACKDEPGSAQEVANLKRAKGVPKTTTVVTTPVPYGKKVPCQTLLDAAKLGASLGKQVNIVDGQPDGDAAAVCAVKLVGAPPTAAQQKRMFEKNDKVLGVLPGDELCQITAYCWYPVDKAEQQKNCESRGEATSTEIGELTCIKSIEAGENYRYVVATIDPDTRCRFVVNGGPSVTDEATVKSCAKAAVDTIGPDNLKVP
jgi:hypothetical protein